MATPGNPYGSSTGSRFPAPPKFSSEWDKRWPDSFDGVWPDDVSFGLFDPLRQGVAEGNRIVNEQAALGNPTIRTDQTRAAREAATAPRVTPIPYFGGTPTYRGGYSGRVPAAAPVQTLPPQGSLTGFPTVPLPPVFVNANEKSGPPSLADIYRPIDTRQIVSDRNRDIGMIDANYAQRARELKSRRAELEARYTLAPTQGEKDELARQLASIRQQQANADGAIQAAYGAANAAVTASQQAVNGVTGDNVQAITAGRDSSLAAIEAAIAAARAASGSAAAVGGGGQPIEGLPAGASASIVSQAAANDVNTARLLGQSTSQGMDFAKTLMQGEMASQQGAAVRQGQQALDSAQTEWGRQTQDRINTEKASKMAAIDRLVEMGMATQDDAFKLKLGVSQQAAGKVTDIRIAEQQGLRDARIADAQAKFQWEQDSKAALAAEQAKQADRLASQPVLGDPALLAKAAAMPALSYKDKNQMDAQIPAPVFQFQTQMLVNALAGSKTPLDRQQALQGWMSQMMQMFPGVPSDALFLALERSGLGQQTLGMR